MNFATKRLAGAIAGFFLLFSQPVSSEQAPNQVKMTFLGVSSFLIEGPSETLLIDGFFSRMGMLTLKKQKPEMTRIEQVLDYLCLERKGTRPDGQKDRYCNGKSRKKLSYVIPMHGHFDHALDSAYVAARTGAQLVTDQSGLRIRDATMRFFKDRTDQFDWDVRPIVHKDLQSKEPKRLAFDNGGVTLFHVPHARNLVYGKFDPITKKGFAFRSSIFRLGEGTSLAAHIKSANGAMLIVASPKMPEKKLETVELEADVVFLSLGGLGLKSKTEIQDYFRAAVINAKARRVYPIHWDKAKTALVPKPHALKPMFPTLHKQVLRIVEDLARACDVEFNAIPIVIPFDPLANLPAKPKGPPSARCESALQHD